MLNYCMASPAQTVPTTTGELLFQTYLEAMHYPYEFEKQFPGKKRKPDYTVTKNGVFLFDVKDFAPYAPLGGGAFDPYPQIREKIHAGKKKFKEFKEFPCSLVLKNNGNVFVNLESRDIMLGSMYGNAGFIVPICLGNGPMPGDAPPVERAFLGDGKMFSHGKADNASNTTISALITLRHIAVGQRRIDQLWKERKRAEPNYGKADPFTAYDELCKEASTRFTNFDPEEKQLGVIVWENAVARIPLSRELFTGPCDERWGFDDNKQHIVFTGEKLAEWNETDTQVL
jgi:hypothetical protein